MAIEKKVKKDVWKNIFRLIVPHKKKFLWVVTLGLLSTGASLVEPLIYREAINDVAGLFVRQARENAQKDLGLDPDDEPFFRGTTKFFGVSRVVGRINAQAPLPHLGAQFDLVTAHRVCFHRIARREDGEWLEWTGADWKFFINDVRTRLLKPDGRLLLEFNRRADGSSFFTPELRAFFESQGARIVRWKALLAQNPNQRPRFKQIR